LTLSRTAKPAILCGYQRTAKAFSEHDYGIPTRPKEGKKQTRPRTYLTFAKVFQSYGIEIINYYADTGEWHPATWFLSAEHRKLVKSEIERIKKY
jgi:hypothetical protein